MLEQRSVGLVALDAKHGGLVQHEAEAVGRVRQEPQFHHLELQPGLVLGWGLDFWLGVKDQ